MAEKEYIEREAAIRAINGAYQFFEDEKDVFRRIIKSVSTADVAPVRHGRWEYNNSVNFWQCSRCGENAPMHGKWMQLKTHYCPNCGAKMDLEGGNT